jgi:hypothetical protein
LHRLRLLRQSIQEVVHQKTLIHEVLFLVGDFLNGLTKKPQSMQCVN